MFSGIAAITRCVNLAECCTRRYRVDRGAFYRNTVRERNEEDSRTLTNRIRSFEGSWTIGGPRLGLVLAGKIERGCHSAGIRLSAHVVRIYRKIDIGSETMVLPMQRILREPDRARFKYP